MAGEMARKRIALEYCARMNAGDLEGVLALFRDDAVFEDPVGSPRALREHLARAIAGRVSEEPGTPVAAMDGRHVLLPATVTVSDPSVPRGKRVRYTLIGLLGVGDDGLIEDVRVFWSASDVTLVDEEPATGRTGTP
ncbi:MULTISPECIES: nuclear transport factor 2 family protein [unclassified Actinomadura]|uniref:nuclear transport factor 2 family protein n=1 Tax=unclassified Actinomadura TaxID=2626254 RepID=UPI0011EFAE7D|nr:nuclear transport factor 2 family protein [Actinomadura sp. K4S16]